MYYRNQLGQCYFGYIHSLEEYTYNKILDDGLLHRINYEGLRIYFLQKYMPSRRARRIILRFLVRIVRIFKQVYGRDVNISLMHPVHGPQTIRIRPHEKQILSKISKIMWVSSYTIDDVSVKSICTWWLCVFILYVSFLAIIPLFSIYVIVTKYTIFSTVVYMFMVTYVGYLVVVHVMVDTEDMFT